MIWFILVVIFAITFMIGIIKDEEPVFVVSFILGALSLVIFVGTAFSGITDYPYLLKEKERILMLEKGIEDIRGATYNQKQNTNTIVSGDLANLKQSTVLSEYISEVYKEKSEFNAYLQKVQHYEKNILMKWLLDGVFISNQVHGITKFE